MSYIQSLKKIINIGSLFFYTGIFLLPSSFFLGATFLMVASITGTIYQKENYFEDIWNKLFFISGLLMLLSSLLQFFIFKNSFENIWTPNLSLIGLGNWLPFFWFFWGIQPFLNSQDKRKIISLILICGSLPILITGFGQYFFDWTGPFETLNGLIVWYQRPIDKGSGLTGLFNNQNYAGSCLLFILPFSLATIFDNSKKKKVKIFSIIFLILICFAILLTNSRNAWLGLIISIPFVIGTNSILWLMFSLGVLGFILFICISSIFSGEIQNIFRNLIPTKMWMEFTNEGFKELDVTRLEILYSAFKMSLINPLFGIGAAAFTALYSYETGFWKGHSHNLIMELALSYGYPVVIIIFSTITSLVFLSFEIIFKNIKINYFEKAWWTATFVFLISQLFDIQYFDGRISLLFWIMLAGLKCIISEKMITVLETN